MNKTQIRQLKRIRLRCSKYANALNAMADELIKLKLNFSPEIYRAIDELTSAMVKACNAENAIIYAIRTEQEDYLQTSYNL